MTGPLVYRHRVRLCRTDLQFSLLRKEQRDMLMFLKNFHAHKNTLKYPLLDGINGIIAVFEDFFFFLIVLDFKNISCKTTSIDARSCVNLTPMGMSGGEQRKGRANREIKSWL